MDELEILKRDWKTKDHSFNQITEKEIYGMLHKRSSSIVKWILIISILEVLLWTFVSVFFNSDDYLKQIKHIEFLPYFQAMTYFNYAVILIFIYLFYKNI